MIASLDSMFSHILGRVPMNTAPLLVLFKLPYENKGLSRIKIGSTSW